jgi:hypothetical protein
MTFAKRALPVLALAAAPVIVHAVHRASGAAARHSDTGAPHPVAAAPVPDEAPSDAAAPDAAAIDPDADRLLRQMTDYLAGLRTFRVIGTSIDEVVTTTGRKIQVVAQSQISMQRPNKLRSDQIGAEGGLEYWYDGKTMSLYCKADNTFSTAPAPPTIDETIDATRKQYKIEAPGADLLFSHPYEILTEQVKSGLVIGRETVSGQAANHLAFEGEEVDWQIWIQEGDKPLPLRFVITTKTMKEQPEFTVELAHWEPDVPIDESVFEFKPPAGATSVSSFPTRCRQRAR